MVKLERILNSFTDINPVYQWDVSAAQKKFSDEFQSV